MHPVSLARFGRLLREVEGIAGGQLHPGGQLIAGDAGVEVGLSRPLLLVNAIQPRKQVAYLIDNLHLNETWWKALTTAGDNIGRRWQGLTTSANDLAAKTTELKGQGVKFTTEPRPLKLAGGATVNFAYLEGPAGAKIELVQR